MSILLALTTTALALLSGETEEEPDSRLAHRLGVEYDPEQPFRLGPVVFDPDHGIGSTGVNRNVNHLGFVVWMTPVDYLALNPPLSGEDSSHVWLEEQIRKGIPVAPSWLDVGFIHEAWEADRTPRSEGGPAWFRVVGHEGRHRMGLIQKLYGPDVVVPVPVLVPRWRARNLTPQMLLGARLDPDRDAPGGTPFVVRQVTLHKQNYELSGIAPPLAGPVVPVLRIPTVWHMGTLERRHRRIRGESHEGHALSVTDDEHIDDWRRIAQLGGQPLWRLDKPGGRFLDRHAVDDDDVAAWALSSGMLARGELWAATWWDSELEDEVTALFDDPDDAEEEAESNDGSVEKVNALVPTEKMRRITMQTQPAFAMDMAALMWARYLGLDGVWWEDDEGAWSAPRGGVLPSRLGSWKTTMMDEGDSMQPAVEYALVDIEDIPTGGHSERSIPHKLAIIRSLGSWSSTTRVALLVGDDNRVMHGHDEIEAARRAGLTHIPALCISQEAFSNKMRLFGDDPGMANTAVMLIAGEHGMDEWVTPKEAGLPLPRIP